MTLLGIRDLVLPLRAGGRGGCAAHEHEFIDTRYRSAQETEAILPAVDIEHRESRSVHGEDVSHKAMVREVAVIELAPPLGMELAQAVVEVLMLRDAIIEAAIVQSHGDVIVHVEGLARRVGRVNPFAAGQPEAGLLGLVAWIQNRVVNGIETDHAFVNVGAGVVHAVIVKPEEGLLLRVVIACRIVEIEVIHPLLRYVPAFVVRKVVGLAIALRRRVAVVQVSKERPVRRAEVLAITAQGIQVQVVLKAYQVGLPIHGVDSGAGESPVEAVNRAGGQKLRACDPSLAGTTGRPPLVMGCTCELVKECVPTCSLMWYSFGFGSGKPGTLMPLLVPDTPLPSVQSWCVPASGTAGPGTPAVRPRAPIASCRPRSGLGGRTTLLPNADVRTLQASGAFGVSVPSGCRYPGSIAEG